MSLDDIRRELREVFGGMLRHADGNTRLQLLDLTADEWKQAAAMHDLLQKTTVLLSLSDSAFDAVHLGEIDLPKCLQSIHRDVLQAEAVQLDQAASND